MGIYNPDRPYVLGMQWAPVVADAVVLDTSSEVGYTFKARVDHDPSQGLERVWLLTTVPAPGQPSRKELVAQLYGKQGVAGTGPIRKMVIPCVSGAVQAGAIVNGGAATVNDAVQNQSDSRHVALTGPDAACRFWFDTDSPRVDAALRWRRILDVSVLYSISGPFAQLSPAVTLGLERPSAALNWAMDETLTGPPAQTAETMPRRARLGELNPWWSTADTPASTPKRLPWKWAGNRAPTSGLTAMAASGGTNINVRLQVSASAAADAVFQVHYLALEITYCEENRLGGGGLAISDGAVLLDGIHRYEIPIRSMANYGDLIGLRAGHQYALTVGQAYAGQLSVASPVPVRVNRLGAVDPFPDHQGVLLRKTLRVGSVPTAATVNEMPAIIAVTGPEEPGRVDASSHPYLAQAVGTLYSRYGPAATTQKIADEAAGLFVWARFYARHLPGTRDPLELMQVAPEDPDIRLGPQAAISVDEFDALPELASGWKEVTLRLNPPAVMTGGGAITRWAFYSSAGQDVPWQILGADHNPASLDSIPANDAGYGGEAVHATYDGTDDLSADLTLMLMQELDQVTGLRITAAVQPLTAVDGECGWPINAIPTGIRYHHLSWDPVNTAVVSGWGHYEVQRQDDTMPADEWETIAIVVEPNVATVDDYEARVGVRSRYRIRMVHRIGLAGPWSAPVTATIVAPGVTGTGVDVGVLIMTSNHNPAANLAYVASWERQSIEEFTFPESGDVELLAMFGRDYRAAFRPLERGGVEFTRTLLVNAAAVPRATMDKGFRELRDLAWDTLPYVCVRDELNNRWLATLTVPSAKVQRIPTRGQLHLAQVSVAEVTDIPAPIDGGPAPCEGLRPEGTVTEVTAATDAVPDMAPVQVEDRFTRYVPVGDWGRTEWPGRPWTVEQGRADDVRVAGGAGLITLVDARNANPFFETDASDWTSFGGTFARSTTFAHQGSTSGLLTPDGVSATVRVESGQVFGAAAGQDWRGTAWVRCPVARNVAPEIRWYDADGVLLSTVVGPPVALMANTWTRVAIDGSTPNPAAARVAFGVSMDASPPATNVLYLDEAVIGRGPTSTRIITGPDQLDVDVQARFRVDAAALTQPFNGYLIGRYVDGDNFYSARLAINPDGTLGVGLEKLVGGVPTTIAKPEAQVDEDLDQVTWAPGDWIWLRMQVRGSVVRAAAWKDSGRLGGWTAQAVDTSLAVAGRHGVQASVTTGNTTSAATMSVDTYTVRAPMGDVDARVELRTGELWAVAMESYSFAGPNQIRSGWDIMWSDAESCFEVFGKDVFRQCVGADALALVPRQRRWLRATYEQEAGGGVARLNLYTSLDGMVWDLVHTATDFPEPLGLDPGFFNVWVQGDVTVSRVEIRNGIDGPLIASPDFEAQPPGTTTFVDAQCNTWRVDGRGICATG